MQRAIDFIHSKSTTNTQRTKLAVLATMEVYHGPKWRQWAEKWLSGEDRSEEAVEAAAADGAAYEAAAWAAKVANGAAYWAADGAAYKATDVATRAVERAEEARKEEIEADAQKWAGDNWQAVAEVWYSQRSIDWAKLIEQAKTGE